MEEKDSTMSGNLEVISIEASCIETESTYSVLVRNRSILPSASEAGETRQRLVFLSEAIQIRRILFSLFDPRKESGFGHLSQGAQPELISASDSINQSTNAKSPPHFRVQPSLETNVKLIERNQTPQVNPEVLLRSVSKIAAASYTDQS